MKWMKILWRNIMTSGRGAAGECWQEFLQATKLAITAPAAKLRSTLLKDAPLWIWLKHRKRGENTSRFPTPQLLGDSDPIGNGLMSKRNWRGSQGRHNTVETMLAPRPWPGGTCSRVKFKSAAHAPSTRSRRRCWSDVTKVKVKISV